MSLTIGNKKTGEDYSDNSNIKIYLNTEKSPGDLRLAVTLTTYADVNKTVKGVYQ